MGEKYMEIEDFSIFYKITGHGPSTLLLIHGAVGSVNDFSLQMSDENYGLNKDEFTIVAFDLPGFGKSKYLKEEEKQKEKEKENKFKRSYYHERPKRFFNIMPTMEYFELSARLGAKLMSLLNYKTYSVCGWSDGARVASLLAIKFKSRVNSLLLFGFVPIMDKHSCEALSRTRDTATWNKNCLKFYTDIYGEQNFSDLWKEYVDYIISTLEFPQQFDIREQLKEIKCPTLILHGNEDPIVDFKKHVKPLHMQIYDSDIVQLPNMSHNIHQANPEKFNSLLTTLMISARA